MASEKLTKIIISGNITTIGTNAFNGCKNLEYLIYTGTTQVKCSKATFAGSAVASFKVPTNFDSAAKSLCSTITTPLSRELEVGILSSKIEYIIEGDGTLSVYGKGDMNDYWYNSPLYMNEIVKIIIIYNGITSIGNTAFLTMTSVTSVSIPKSVTKIGMNPFAREYSLTNIELNGNEHFVFENDCLYDKNKTRLITYLSSNQRTSFYIPETVKILDFDVFSNTKIKTLMLPDSIEEIGTYSFFSSQIATLYIGKNVKTIKENPFINTKQLTNFIVDTENPHFVYINGALMDKNQTRLISYLMTNKQLSFTIPDGIKQIDDYAFAYNTYIQEINIPSSVNKIDGYVFTGSPNLVTVTFKGLKEPSTCSSTAFFDTSQIPNVKVPKNYDGKTFCSKNTIETS